MKIIIGNLLQLELQQASVKAKGMITLNQGIYPKSEKKMIQRFQLLIMK